jgi:hypothetical protein
MHGIRSRRDSTHAAIRDALRACGCSVLDLGDAGRNVPDLLVGRHKVSYLIEVKSPKGKERPGQLATRTAWRGGTWSLVHSVPEALAAIGMPSAIQT